MIGFVLCAVVNGFLFEHFELLESEVNDHTGYSQAPVSASEVFVFKCFWFLCEACTISVLSQTLILFSEYIWLLPKMQARTIRAHYIDPFLPGLALKGLVASFVLLIFKGHIHHHSTRASVSA